VHPVEESRWLSSTKHWEINKMIKNISIENRWIGLCFILFFGLLGIALPVIEIFFTTFSTNLILTLAIFYKVNKDFSPRFWFFLC
jgi:hypothetical protein